MFQQVHELGREHEPTTSTPCACGRVPLHPATPLSDAVAGPRRRGTGPGWMSRRLYPKRRRSMRASKSRSSAMRSTSRCVEADARRVLTRHPQPLQLHLRREQVGGSPGVWMRPGTCPSPKRHPLRWGSGFSGWRRRGREALGCANSPRGARTRYGVVQMPTSSGIQASALPAVSLLQARSRCCTRGGPQPKDCGRKKVRWPSQRSRWRCAGEGGEARQGLSGPCARHPA